jgi:hypothetical protein
MRMFVQRRMKIDKVGRIKNIISTTSIAVPKLGGLIKLEITPGGGIIAGPCRMASSIAGVKL